MLKLIKKILLISLPYTICAVAIIAIDPYNLFEASNFFSEASKKRVMHRSTNAIVYDNAIYDFNKFMKHPSPNIILGDSRSFGLDINYINSKSQDKYLNLSVPGGDLKSICDSLEFAIKYTKIRKVVIAISFHNSNAKNRSDIVPETEKVLNNRVALFVNKRMLGACIALLNYEKIDEKLKQRNLRNAGGRMTRWEKALDDLTFDDYEYPQKELNRLKDLIDYCKLNQVKFKLIVFPNHVDVEKIIISHDLMKYKADFLNFFTQSNIVYDFDYPNDFTKNYDNYRDPLHPKDWAYNEIADTVFGFKDTENRAKIPYKLFNNGIQVR